METVNAIYALYVLYQLRRNSIPRISIRTQPESLVTFIYNCILFYFINDLCLHDSYIMLSGCVRFTAFDLQFIVIINIHFSVHYNYLLKNVGFH
jgi:hypothetical protein